MGAIFDGKNRQAAHRIFRNRKFGKLFRGPRAACATDGHATGLEPGCFDANSGAFQLKRSAASFPGDFSQRPDPDIAVRTGISEAAAVGCARQGAHGRCVDPAPAFAALLRFRRVRADEFTLHGTGRSSGDRQYGTAQPALYAFLPGHGAAVLAGAGIKRAAGATTFLGCLGFLCSRLLRCSPLGIRVLLI